MCYQSNCAKCSKTTWQGCGRHVASVYKQIPQGEHCLCKDWPGVSTEKTEKEGGPGTDGTGTSTGSEPQAGTCSVM